MGKSKTIDQPLSFHDRPIAGLEPAALLLDVHLNQLDVQCSWICPETSFIRE